MCDVSRQLVYGMTVNKALSYLFFYLPIDETAMLRLFVKFYFIIFLGVLVYLLFGLYSQHTWLREDIEEDRTSDLIGTIYLLDAMYENLGSVAFTEKMGQYPATSNIPVEISDIHSLKLPPESKAILRNGQQLTNREMVSYDSPRDIVLYYNFPGSDLVVGVGPLGRRQALDSIVVFYERSILLVVAIPIILIMFNIFSKLKRLERAATNFGNGNFGVRVSQEKKHSIGNLNRHFNRMAERVEHLIKGHKELSNAVAHELRTPVSRIRFELDMMQMESDESVRNEYMYGISDNINELADLVDELLTYARFDREITGLELKPHSLDASLKSIISARVFNSNIQFSYDSSWTSEKGSLDQVGFDPKHMERAIGNLVSNAEKYAESKVHVQVKQLNYFTYIYVDDDGPGIPADERIDIFTPFKRLDTSRTRATGGFGLGLSIVKQIAQWHGGDVTVETSASGGARFIFAWPT